MRPLPSSTTARWTTVYFIILSTSTSREQIREAASDVHVSKVRENKSMRRTRENAEEMNDIVVDKNSQKHYCLSA
jgi:GGDEF domain-containing protein